MGFLRFDSTSLHSLPPIYPSLIHKLFLSILSVLSFFRLPTSPLDQTRHVLRPTPAHCIPYSLSHTLSLSLTGNATKQPGDCIPLAPAVILLYDVQILPGAALDPPQLPELHLFLILSNVIAFQNSNCLYRFGIARQSVGARRAILPAY